MLEALMFILGVGAGLTAPAAWRVLSSWHPRPEPEAKYGHPQPPASTLRKALPKPPLGHVWEVAVVTNRDGEPVLTLVLLDVASFTARATREMNLVRGGYPWQTWAAYYRNWGHGLEGRATFRQKIIGPLTDWAYEQVRKFTPEGTVTDYTIGDAHA